MNIQYPFKPNIKTCNNSHEYGLLAFVHLKNSVLINFSESKGYEYHFTFTFSIMINTCTICTHTKDLLGTMKSELQNMSYWIIMLKYEQLKNGLWIL